MTIKKTARFAGLSYLSIIIFGIFSHIIVRGNIIVSNDSARTAANILSQETLFRMSIVSDLLMVLSYLGLGICLYFLFKPIHKKKCHCSITAKCYWSIYDGSKYVQSIYCALFIKRFTISHCI